MSSQALWSHKSLASSIENMTSDVSTVIEDNVVKTRVTNAVVPDVDFVTFFSDVWQKHADHKALADVRLDMRYTFGELLDTCRRVAAGLQKCGLRKGDVVAFHCVNSCELIVAMCGTYFAGGITSLIKSSLNEGEARYQLMECQPKFVFFDIENMKKIMNACEGIASVKVNCQKHPLRYYAKNKPLKYGACYRGYSHTNRQRIGSPPPPHTHKKKIQGETFIWWRISQEAVHRRPKNYGQTPGPETFS
nr:uncharacterized protein LOC129381198 [Dermacentor andersoni]